MMTIEHIMPNVQRSDIYGLLLATLEYPDLELADLVKNGRLVARCREMLCAIYPEIGEEMDWDALAGNVTEEELAVEYSRLFDVGAAGPPCPLYGGVYKDSRMPTLEELVRFYSYVGLTTEGAGTELPDHISVQLEFLYYLSLCEEKQSDAEEAEDLQRLQRDFINRHPGHWLPQLLERLEMQRASPFYLSLFQLICRFLSLEKQRLNEASFRIASSSISASAT
jgi:DMSO reductase family type II enzyme chaperone